MGTLGVSTKYHSTEMQESAQTADLGDGTCAHNPHVVARKVVNIGRNVEMANSASMVGGKETSAS